MTRLSVVAAIVLSLAVGVATARAEDQPAPSGQPAAKMSKADRKAVSKSCSDQANAKGLHGKARKKFRSECKSHGGKVE